MDSSWQVPEIGAAAGHSVGGKLLPTDNMSLLEVMQRRVRMNRIEARPELQQTPIPRVTETASEEADISIRKTGFDQPVIDNGASGVSGPTLNILSSEEEAVVDMQRTRHLQNCVSIRDPVPLQNLSINVRQENSSCSAVDGTSDLQVVEEEEGPLKKKGPVTNGVAAAVVSLLDRIPCPGGVILRPEKLYHVDGRYKEGQQYEVLPGSFSKGAFGEAAMCEDMKTKKTFMRKKVKGRLSRNEIEVPLMLQDCKGIPGIYGVTVEGDEVEIFQEFAGLSLKMLIDSGSSDAMQLRDPKRVLVMAFQGFATLVKLHDKGITHQDIKPENLCLSIQSNGVWLLKFIDFGSSQTPKDRVIEGLTNEYLSPESCNTILQIATERMPMEKGRLGPGLDVWALGLSLLYCLCGYHAMVYMFTGDFKYHEKDPFKLQRLRMQCLLRIRDLTDEDIQQRLIHPKWPEELQTLLMNVLRVDPAKRWSAKQAAEYILNWIRTGTQQQQQQQLEGPGVARGAAAEVPAAAQSCSVAPAVPSAVAPGFSFRGLSSARFVAQTQAPLQIRVPAFSERANEGQAVPCTSPTSADFPLSSPPHSPSQLQLPDFNDLLSNATTKKRQRRSRGKQRVEPYRRGSKN